MLKEINATIISLIPKVKTPNKITDYPPISCYNVIYKCIRKIISESLKSGLQDIISVNQAVFVPSRSIFDNILLTRELMKSYHLHRGTPKCASKEVIQKAYDIVEWSFLRDVLVNFGVNLNMVKWIMTCVESVSYSININGNTCLF